jgi:Fur family ferric uptake transcriptional regulator
MARRKRALRFILIMRIVLSSLRKGRRDQEIVQLVEQVAGRLRSTGVRVTSGRRDVIAALTRSRGPVSAAEIHDHVGGSVPLSSIYRTLTVLTDAEVASPHHGRDGITRYELAEPLQDHHHHLVCMECGRIDDVEFGRDAERAVRGAIEAVATDHGFAATDHTIEIEGRCQRCA